MPCLSEKYASQYSIIPYNVYCNFPLNTSMSFTYDPWLFYWTALKLNFITLKNITLNRLNSYKLYLHVINQ